jgi:glycosyltransferase involved in cell wall biosynthesis
MEITLTTPDFRPVSGIQLQMLQMSRELARRGHRIDLLFNEDEGELRPEFESFCASMSEVPTFRFDRHKAFSTFVHLLPAIRATVRAKPDVIWVNQEYQLQLGLMSGLVARAPVICHLHGCDLSPEEIRASMIPRLAARAQRLIACSENVRNQFIDGGIDPQKIVTIHNGIALGDYPPATEAQRTAARQELGLPLDAFVTLFLGRLESVKGVEVLLNAWRQLAFPPEEARLLVVGSAVYLDTEARARELRDLAPPGCHWLPSRRDVLTPLQAADVIVVPSLWPEAFGRVVVEGLAAGLPVVASRVGGIPEILGGDLDELLVEPGSVEELREKLTSLIDWRRNRPDLGELCSRAAERFSIERMVDGVESVLRDAVR